jgi:hypothetical protein
MVAQVDSLQLASGEQTHMKKTVWTFGLISGAILSVMMLVTVPFIDSIGYDRGEVIGYTTMVLSFLLVYFGIRSYRDTAGGGSVSFRRALAIGVLITAVSSLCYVATWELLYYKLSPDFQAKMITAVIEKAKRSGGSPEEIQRQVADAQRYMEAYKNPLLNSAITFLEPLPIGVLIALISAGILRRKRDEGGHAALATSSAV